MLTQNQQLDTLDSIQQELRGYLGNPNLLLAGEKYQYTKEELIEFAKCANDYDYFIRNYVKIVHVDKGLIQFIPFQYQDKIIKTINDNRFVICKLPRQSGKTTAVVSYILWYIIFHANVNVAILAHRAKTARELFSRIRLAYEKLPKFIQAGIAPGGWNKGSIILGNGSSIIADATSSGSIRGESFNVILLDEFSFVEPNLADEFLESVYPTISSGTSTKLIIVSTPKGYNHFYDIWSNAVEGKNEFIPIEVKWNEVPGRDEAWKQKQIANIGIQKWNQEFEAEFIGSSTTLLSADALYDMENHVKDVVPIYNKDDHIIFKEPIPGHQYSILVDVARGLGLDYSTLQIIDVTNIPFEQVGTFHSNKIYPTILPNVIYNTGMKYNGASVLIEISDIGGQVADMLIGDLDYENVIRVASKPLVGQSISLGMGNAKIQNGLKTSPATKRVGCADLKTLIESKKLIVNDIHTFNEFRTFVSNNISYEAEEGKNDDLVMGLVLFGWLSHQRYFREETHDIRADLQKAHEDYLENQLTPFGIFDDGLTEQQYDYDNNSMEIFNKIFPN